MTGILGGQWVLADFTPMENVPTGGRLTAYSGEAADISAVQLQKCGTLATSGDLGMQLRPGFPLDTLRDAHPALDANSAGGRIVIEVDRAVLPAHGCSPLQVVTVQPNSYFG